jgi:hypothetical protein
VKKLLSLLGFDDKDKKEDISDLSKPLDALYPMLTQMNSYSMNVKIVAQYISQMDTLATKDIEEEE